jgi:hypothetical protein
MRILMPRSRYVMDGPTLPGVAMSPGGTAWVRSAWGAGPSKSEVISIGTVYQTMCADRCLTRQSCLARPRPPTRRVD